jgi:ribosomal protein S18 acetylase RimI-like enzyme
MEGRPLPRIHLLLAVLALSYRSGGLLPLLHIRLAGLHDVLAIRTLLFASLQDDASGPQVPATEQLHQILVTRGSSCYVAETTGPGEPHLVGVIARVLRDPSFELPARGHVSMLAVDPSFRRRGVATELMRVALRELDAWVAPDGDRCTLFVRPNNLRAQALYRRFGFSLHRRVPEYYPALNYAALGGEANHVSPSHDMGERTGLLFLRYRGGAMLSASLSKFSRAAACSTGSGSPNK